MASAAVADLLVESGATANIALPVIGSQADSLGRLTVDGAHSSLVSSDRIRVGHDGLGLLTLQNAASADVRFLDIGYGNGTGIVHVTGNGSVLNTQSVNALNSPDSSIQIEDGGVVNVAGDSRLISLLTPTHSASLVLNNGELTTDRLFVDMNKISGVGTINANSTVFDGDFVLDQSLPSSITLSNNPGDAVTLNLAWRDDRTVFGAGAGGNSNITITNGFDFMNQDGYIGLLSTSNGLISVNGQATRWELTGRLAVGYGGTGRLDLSDRGVVKVGNETQVGYAAGSTGVVDVDGAGSILDAGFLRVGLAGSGRVHIQNAGLVIAEQSTEVGGGVDGIGLIEVTGSDSTLFTNGIELADRGNAEVRFTDGAAGFVGKVTIGYGSRSTKGLLLVDGPDTTLETARMDLGRLGEAVLEFRNGATVRSFGRIGLGDDRSSPAAPVRAIVSGPQTSWITQDMTLGVAELTARDGAMLTSDAVRVGHFRFRAASADLSGANTHWQIKKDLVVGENDSYGYLALTDGASADVAGSLTLNRDSMLSLGVLTDRPTLSVQADATIDGGLNLSALPGMLPSDGSETVILEVKGESTGLFQDLAQGDLVDVSFGVAMRIDYFAGDGNDIGVVSSVHLPSDIDGSGDVDQLDLNQVLINWGNDVERGDWLAGDVSHDGWVGVADLELVLSQWTGSEEPNLLSVPEPQSLALFLTALLLSSGRQNRKVSATRPWSQV